MARVCSTEYVFHTLLDPKDGIIESILENGLRPLSDFPDSERWQQIVHQMPGFFENLYQEIAYPVIRKPYSNSGVFVSPIDFRLMPESFMHDRTRVKVPVSRLEPEYAVLTYVLDGKRVSLPLNAANLEETANIWDASMVDEWFARDNTKVFFYVPQIATYQPGGISVESNDIE
jgi:hypothetical protein